MSYWYGTDLIYLLRLSDPWKRRRPPLLSHLLLHSQSQWGCLEEAIRLRDFDSFICVLGVTKLWSHTRSRLPLKLFSVTLCKVSGLNSATKGMNCSSHQHRAHLGQTPCSVLWGQYIYRITYPSLCRQNALFWKTFFSLFPPKLLFPGGNGLSTSLKHRSDLLGNP